MDEIEGTSEPTLDEQLDAAIGLTEDEAEITPSPDVEPADVAPAAAPVDSAAPAALPVDPVVPVVPEAKPDPNADLYAPLPEHNQRKTQERFAKLVEGHKDLTQRAETVTKERDEFKATVDRYEQGLQPLREMGFDSPEAVQDLQQFAQYRNALASGNVDAAMGLLQQQLNELALASGRRVSVDPLASFPDLADRVNQGSLDDASALELARLRYGQHVQGQNQQRAQASQQQSQDARQAVHQAALQVDQVVLQLQRDPDFARVEPLLMKQLEDIKTNYHPTQWPREIKRVYDNEARVLRLQASQAAPRQQHQPLRANGHGGGQPAPTSAQDAVMQALGF